MPAISSVQQIVATLRAEMADHVARRHRAAGTRVPASPSAQAPMGSLISQRVQALDPDDPRRNSKAFRIFLESVLLSEFGMELINDHAFYRMVDQVQEQMEQDPRIADAIGRAVESLLKKP
ncbi:hypothetical protein GCM10027277_07790 [Pseudoduganella ginsengisoli]|uniref:Uncharacterized protein n=1 Tax=Pseudoduganella ginsengisoli TaxID=1462440 RepID=A0A6L6Q2G8_9BURK|nr:hypothetical protein [Pseudoduganella ginsengisoli]MTW03272.1 hypothetical protein [Pseudoduganella ginsengisoli]